MGFQLRCQSLISEALNKSFLNLKKTIPLKTFIFLRIRRFTQVGRSAVQILFKEQFCSSMLLF